ncbi:MAG: prolyl-tRNA synthetase associated domain-containing protein [Candidatus Limivicinus sp.]|jgi:Ala-tRNA(Pro) deacylase
MQIDSTLYTGRPDDKRIDKEERCYELLDRLNIEYRRADHEHADTIEACHEVEKLLGCSICKNLLLTNRQKTALYLLMMPGDKPFKTKVLSKEIGSARLSFAAPEQMEEHLDITPGSVSVLGLMNDKEGAVRLIIDRDLLKDEFLGCHPCINTSTLKISFSDVIDKLIPAMSHDITYVDLPWECD